MKLLMNSKKPAAPLDVGASRRHAVLATFAFFGGVIALELLSSAGVSPSWKEILTTPLVEIPVATAGEAVTAKERRSAKSKPDDADPASAKRVASARDKSRAEKASKEKVMVRTAAVPASKKKSAEAREKPPAPAEREAFVERPAKPPASPARASPPAEEKPRPVPQKPRETAASPLERELAVAERNDAAPLADPTDTAPAEPSSVEPSEAPKADPTALERDLNDLLARGGERLHRGDDPPILRVRFALEDIERLVARGEGIVIGEYERKAYRVIPAAGGSLTEGSELVVATEERLDEASRQSIRLNGPYAARLRDLEQALAARLEAPRSEEVKISFCLSE
jgi:hypothetical protein